MCVCVCVCVCVDSQLFAQATAQRRRQREEARRLKYVSEEEMDAMDRAEHVPAPQSARTCHLIHDAGRSFLGRKAAVCAVCDEVQFAAEERSEYGPHKSSVWTYYSVEEMKSFAKPLRPYHENVPQLLLRQYQVHEQVQERIQFFSLVQAKLTSNSLRAVERNDAHPPRRARARRGRCCHQIASVQHLSAESAEAKNSSDLDRQRVTSRLFAGGVQRHDSCGVCTREFVSERVCVCSDSFMVVCALCFCVCRQIRCTAYLALSVCMAVAPKL